MSNNYFGPQNVNNYWAEEASLRAERAQEQAKRYQEDLSNQRDSNVSNIDLIFQLRNKVGHQAESAKNLQENNARLQSEKQFFEHLLSLPMKEIAEKNENFKATYEAQQLVLAKWILSQKAYQETAVQMGINAGKTTQEIEDMYKNNVVSVLANTTKHGNNAIVSPVLKENITKLIKK